MANVKISDLPAVTSVGGTDQYETNQGGTSRRATAAQIVTYAESAIGTSTGRAVLTAADAAAARTAISAVPAGPVSASGLLMSGNHLLGRTAGTIGEPNDIVVGAGLTLSAGTLSAGAVGVDRQVFNGSGTWTKPTGFASTAVVLLQAWGAGGSGARINGTRGGGGGGGYNERWLTLGDLSGTETITIGAGGASRTGSNQNGAAGGNTTIGSLLTAYGGGGGTQTTALGGGGGGQLSAGSGAQPGLPALAGFPRDAVLTDNATLAGRGAAGGETPRHAATGFWHGGGGGGFDGTNTRPIGASSVWGGGGGGGDNTTGSGGVSVHGGSGGVGGGTTGAAGSQPGGGGGAGTSTSGAGGDGRAIITVFG
jgi:hypothetical protein